MRLSLFKKILLTMVGVGVVGSLVSVGTFASFTATTNNPANTFAAGTLVMTNNGSTPCTAKGNGEACGIVPLSPASQNYGSGTTTIINNMEPGAVLTGSISITNAGTLPASFSIYFKNNLGTAGTNTSACGGSCSPLTSTTASTSNQLVIAVFDTTTSKCIFGSTVALAATCDSSISGGTALNASTWNSFNAPTTSGTAITIPSLATASQTNGKNSPKWDPNESHTFTLYVTMPTDAGNAYQGASGNFDVYWYATQ